MNHNGMLERYPKIIFIFLFGQLITIVYLFKLKGLDLSPIIGLDSNFFLDSAARFPNLRPPQVLYSGMAVYYKIASLFGPIQWIAVIGNSIAVIVSGEFLWQITKKYSSQNCAWIAVYIWLLNPLTAQWTRWLMTEPLYFSAVIIWLWLAIFQTSFLLLFFSTLASTLRPNAFILLGAAIFWSYLLNKKLKIKQIINNVIIFILIFLALMTIVFILYNDSFSLLIKSFSEGEVIWNMPELFVEKSSSPLFYLNVFFRRIGWELIQIRPWYSFKHNFLISIFMSFFYFFSIRGAWIVRKSQLLLAITLITIPSLLCIGFTWSIYEGRFGWWFLVSWIPLAAIGTQRNKLI